ncbi:hypothetical protein E2C01_088122 [Portunus trituberculatus]|uniref:Uncharacterized protein n=1 Tax=Portunus trituberculatus TaxID=210409 RepID=A0A5B7JIC7_PORTR|nr:hypothetical protein [Portunus trituberculatus]
MSPQHTSDSYTKRSVSREVVFSTLPSGLIWGRIKGRVVKGGGDLINRLECAREECGDVESRYSGKMTKVGNAC